MTACGSRSSLSNSAPCIVGLGSAHGDDRVGWIAAGRLNAELKGDVAVRLAASPASLLDWLTADMRLIICDACRGLGESGRIARWKWPNVALAGLQSSSSHQLALADVLEVASRLGRLPRDITIFAVEISETAPDCELSAPVASAIDELVRIVRQEVDHA